MSIKNCNRKPSREEQDAMEQAIKEVERPLLEAAREIGGIAESNALYTLKLARRIQATGRDPLDMTLRELLRIDRECSEEYNRRMADLDRRLEQQAQANG